MMGLGMKKAILLMVLAGLPFFFASRVLAQETALPTPPPLKVDYPLPYPGVLPDSPLWVFKDLRDRLVSFLLFDPLTKARYYLLLADKRLAAGITLINYGKNALGEKTIVEGEQYLQLAAEQGVRLAEQKPENRDYLGVLTIAIAKHQELITENSVKMGTPSGLQNSLRRLLENQQRVKNLFENKLQNLPRK